MVTFVKTGTTMANIIFIILHIIAIYFGFWMLIITIPLHVIFLAIPKKDKEKTKDTE
jgi:type IV secretory pathway VirB3-like protein